jgi:hypothetical protein
MYRFIFKIRVGPTDHEINFSFATTGNGTRDFNVQTKYL